jgi:ribosomal protein S18 acetylase RimI-like enzyme
VAIDIRPVSGMEQLERWVAVQNEVRPDDPETTSMKALIRAQESGHVDLLAYVEEEPAGTGMLADDPGSRTGHPWVEVNVLPGHRGRGVGRALFGALSNHARERGASGLACEVRADDAYSLSFLTRRGYVEYGRFDHGTLDLVADPPSDPVVPNGITLEWLDERPSLLEGMHAVATAAYPELGGNRSLQAEDFVDWQVYELGSPATILEAVPVAVADGQVVGFATMRKLLDRTTGELRTVVVLPEWRRRGIASALLRAQLVKAAATGITSVIVWVRHNQPSDLFRGLGFRVAQGAILLRGPLL